MNRNENSDLALHLFIIGIFFLSTVASCSTVYYYSNRQHPNELGADSYKITDKDLTQFASTLRPYRGNPDTLYQQACYLQKRKKYKPALKVLEDVILADPSHVKAYNAMGVTYDILRDFPRAIEAYKRALRLNPDFAYVHNNLGSSYFLQGHFDSAIEAFKAAISLDEGNIRYHNNLGLVYAKKGLYDQAVNEFMAGRDEAGAHYKLAQVLSQMREYDRAEIHFFISSKLSHKVQQAKTKPPAADSLTESGKSYQSKQANGQLRRIPNRVEVDEKGKKKLWFKVNPESFRTTQDDNFKTGISKLNDRPERTEIKNTKEKQFSPNEFTVEISNGNGVNRMAARVGNYLKKKGIKVTRLTNAENFNFDETIIYYHWDHLQDAFKVAQEIPGSQNMEKLRTSDQKSVKIKVRLGKDLVLYDQFFVEHIKDHNNTKKSKRLSKRRI
jgi:tetratricopeptide (TPR) repeat protein